MLTKWLVADSKSLQCITGYLGIVANVANDKVATDAFCLSFNYSFMIYVFSTFIADSYVISYSFKFATPAPNGPSFHESFESAPKLDIAQAFSMAMFPCSAWKKEKGRHRGDVRETAMQFSAQFCLRKTVTLNQ